MFAGTNHLYPKPAHGDDMVNAFATDEQPPITERWGASLFQIARPVVGNDYHSTSIWPDEAAFKTWTASPEFRASHSNINFGWFTGHPLFTTAEVVMNAEPGRTPTLGQPVARKELGAGTAYGYLKLFPTPERRAEVIAAFAALPTPTTPDWRWWDCFSGIGQTADQVLSVAYFSDLATLQGALATFPYLQAPGDASWYTQAPVLELYEVEVERVPGMAANNRWSKTAAAAS